MISFTALAQGAADSGFGDSGLSWLPTVINLALHLFLVGSFFAFGYVLVMVVREPTDSTKRLGRYMALFIGALIVVGAQAWGTSYSGFIVDSLSEGRSPGFRIYGAVVPAVTGLVLGYYLTRGLRKESERAIRGLIIVGTFCITQFALMYAVAIEDTSGELDAAVTPNVAFVAGIGLVIVLNLGVASDSDKPAGGAGWFDRLRGQTTRQPAKTGRRTEFHED